MLFIGRVRELQIYLYIYYCPFENYLLYSNIYNM